MGVFDTIVIHGREMQVKLWDSNLRNFEVGDPVPPFYDDTIADVIPSYSIAVREGGFVNITDDRIVSWTSTPKHVIVVDKFGDRFDPEGTHGLLGEPYQFKGD